MKSDKMPYITYADLESLIKQIDVCANNPEKYLTTRIGEHIPCGYLILWTFDQIRNKYSLYGGEDCMKKFRSSLREHATNVINFEKKKMLPLTKRVKLKLKCGSMLHLWKKIPQKIC